MKTFKNILAWLMIILLGIVYMIDRVVLVLLPWIKVEPIQDWMPKSTDLEQIKKDFPTLSEETHFTIKYTREEMLQLTKISIVRTIVVVFISMCLYLIF